MNFFGLTSNESRRGFFPIRKDYSRRTSAGSSRQPQKNSGFPLVDRYSHPQIERLQGDVVSNFSTVYLDEQGTARSREFTVLILNNTCDLPDDRLDFITAAPIFDFNKYLEFERERQFHGKDTLKDSEKRRIEDRLQEYGRVLRNNDKTEILYLPPFSEFTHGALVLLHLVCSVSARLYRDALHQGRRVASFTQTGFYFLLIKLTTHLARAETAEVIRRPGH